MELPDPVTDGGKHLLICCPEHNQSLFLILPARC